MGPDRDTLFKACGLVSVSSSNFRCFFQTNSTRFRTLSLRTLLAGYNGTGVMEKKMYIALN